MLLGQLCVVWKSFRQHPSQRAESDCQLMCSCFPWSSDCEGFSLHRHSFEFSRFIHIDQEDPKGRSMCLFLLHYVTY